MAEDKIKLALLMLGFDETSSPNSEEVSQAFKTAALKFHPDAGGTEATFRALTFAKELLLGLKPAKKETSKSYEMDEEDETQYQLRLINLYTEEMITNFQSLLSSNKILTRFKLKCILGDVIVQVKDGESSSIIWDESRTIDLAKSKRLKYAPDTLEYLRRIKKLPSNNTKYVYEFNGVKLNVTLTYTYTYNKN